MPTESSALFAGVGLDSDSPKRALEEDRIDVAPFVRRLVDPLLRAPAGESFVLGLYAPWGYGKSTALNFLELELWNASMPARRREAEALDGQQAGCPPAPVIVRFTPWLYADAESLLASFFETLATAFSDQLPDQDARSQLAAGLRVIGQFIAPAAKVGARILVGPAAGLSDGVIDAVSTAAIGAADALKGGEVNYRKRKSEVSRILLALGQGDEPRRLVVLIDDLDRAGPLEIRAMLKLVKLVADLPNVSYVLALDKDRVSRALSESNSVVEGYEYLEKIVQIGVSLPPFPRDRLAQMVAAQAAAVARDARLDATLFEVNWSGWDGLRQDGYIGHIGRAMRTPRDVTRLINAFRFAALSSDSRADVHPVDLLLLCVLQVRFPAVYQAVRNHRRFLLHEEWQQRLARVVGGRDTSDEAIKERLARLSTLLLDAEAKESAAEPALQFAASSSAQRAISRGRFPLELELLLELFPDCAETEADEHELPRLRREARIRSPQHFDGYFRFDPPEGQLRRAEIREVFAELTDEGFSANSAASLAELGARLTPDLRVSLREGLSDESRELALGSAKSLLRSLRLLSAARANVSATETRGQIFPFETIAMLLQRAAIAVRQATDSAIATSPVDAIVAVIEALPDDEAAELAHDFSFRPSRTLNLTDDDILLIARVGLTRAEAAVYAMFPGSTAVRANGRAFSRALWRWRRLASLCSVAPANGVFAPIGGFVRRLLAEDALVVSEIVALAAAWGGDPQTPSLEMHSPTELRDTLSRILDPAEICEVAEGIVQRGEVQQVTWPTLLLGFVGPMRELLNRALAELDDAES